MDYGMISRIEKAKLYAEECEERVDFQSFTATLKGEHRIHEIAFKDKTWTCDCDFFKTRGHCSHTIALERILQGMIPGPGETLSKTGNGNGS